MTKLVNKSYVDYLNRCKPFRMAFADPPDNIGLKYDGFEDSMTNDEYEHLLRNIMLFSMTKCDVLWLSLNSRHATSGKPSRVCRHSHSTSTTITTSATPTASSTV